MQNIYQSCYRLWYRRTNIAKWITRSDIVHNSTKRDCRKVTWLRKQVVFQSTNCSSIHSVYCILCSESILLNVCMYTKVNFVEQNEFLKINLKTMFFCHFLCTIIYFSLVEYWGKNRVTCIKKYIWRDNFTKRMESRSKETNNF